MTIYHVPKIGASFIELRGNSESELRRWQNYEFLGQLAREDEALKDRERTRMQPKAVANDLFYVIDEAVRKVIAETKKRLNL